MYFLWTLTFICSFWVFITIWGIILEVGAACTYIFTLASQDMITCWQNGWRYIRNRKHEPIGCITAFLISGENTMSLTSKSRVLKSINPKHLCTPQHAKTHWTYQPMSLQKAKNLSPGWQSLGSRSFHQRCRQRGPTGPLIYGGRAQSRESPGGPWSAPYWWSPNSPGHTAGESTQLVQKRSELYVICLPARTWWFKESEQ